MFLAFTALDGVGFFVKFDWRIGILDGFWCLACSFQQFQTASDVYGNMSV